MRWHLLLAVIGLSMTGVSCWSQESPSAERLGQLTSGIVRFQMVQGRIGLDAPRHRKGSQSIDESDRFESIRVTANRGIPSLQYICRTPTRHLTVHVANATDLQMESYLPTRGVRCTLRQPPDHLITWQIKENDDDARTLLGSTLVDLRLQNESLFDEHFGYVISKMIPGRSLASFSQRVLEEAIHIAADPMMVDDETVEEWIDDLRHRRQRIRDSAERNLTMCGISILPILQSRVKDASMGNLDPEQRHRLERVIGRLQPRRNDDAKSLARRLVNEPRYWTAVAPKLSSDQRFVVAEHLDQRGIQLPILTDQEAAGALVAEASNITGTTLR